MKLNPLRLRALSSLKGMKKINDYEIVAGGVIIHYNNNSSTIVKSINEFDKEITELIQGREE